MPQAVSKIFRKLPPLRAGNLFLNRIFGGGNGSGGGGGAPGTLPSFTLTSGSTVAAAPFTLGHPFRQGDVPTGQGIVVSGATAQVDIKNRWPDGSVKFGIISGVAALSTTPATITLTRGTASTGTALTTTDLQTAAPVAMVDCGAFGSVTFSGADWLSPNRVWVTGHAMSSWTYRKAVGSDAHLVVWLEVRLYVSGAVEVFPWIENGYIVGGIHTNKAATYTFTLGGTQRFSALVDLKHHTRTPLISGTALTYFVGADPGVTPKHDTAYFQATELVPSYRCAPPDTYVNSRFAASGFTPLQQGDYRFGESYTGNSGSDNMLDSGYSRVIGLMPEWDVLYLTSQNPAAYAIAIRNAMSSGRYHIHFRDNTTQRPIKFSAYPTITVVNDENSTGYAHVPASSAGVYAANGTGGLNAFYDRAHAPTMGAFAYWLTGRMYFMEQTQFQVTGNYLGLTDWVRGGGGRKFGPDYSPANGYTSADYVCHMSHAGDQVRASAWDFRIVAQALTVTPDAGDALRAELINTVQKTTKFVHDLYVAQPHNPWGVVWPGFYNDAQTTFPPWMDDFYTAAFGYALALDLPIDATHKAKLQAFFQWKSKLVVTRLGPAAGFRFEDAGRYLMLISSAPLTSWDEWEYGAGSWYTTEASLYAANASALPHTGSDSTPNALWQWDAGASDPQTMAQSMWGEMQMAISYAVRHNAPGAQASYNRMIGASNWATMAAKWDTVYPVMGVKPYVPPAVVVSTSSISGAAIGLPGVASGVIYGTPPAEPAWLQGKPLNQWFAIPNTAGAQGAAVDIWGGFAINDATSEVWLLASGGHGDSSDNRVVSLLLSADVLGWVLRMPASTATQPDVTHYADGKPTSRHIYHHNWYLPGVGPAMVLGRATYGSGQTSSPYIDVFDEALNTWKNRDAYPQLAPGNGYPNFRDKLTGKIWTNFPRAYNPATNIWESPAVSGIGGAGPGRWPAANDPTRNQAYYLQWDDGQGTAGPGNGGYLSSKLQINTGVFSPVAINPSAAFTQWQAISSHAYTGMDYDTANDRYCYYNGTTGGVVYVIQPNSGNAWDMSILSLGAGSATVPDTPGPGINSRFKYIPALKGFICMPSGASGMYFIRTAL